mmetsp:Transcript_67585/g.158620  ORF Transcript_67585/g.158620 Transcript_67585/m.158620 type:complete len:239 (-) Transcript_67585:172-888(-)
MTVKASWIFHATWSRSTLTGPRTEERVKGRSWATIPRLDLPPPLSPQKLQAAGSKEGEREAQPLAKCQLVVCVGRLLGVVFLGQGVVFLGDPRHLRLKLGLDILGLIGDLLTNAGCSAELVLLLVLRHAPKLVHNVEVMRDPLVFGGLIAEQVEHLLIASPDDRRDTHAARLMGAQEHARGRIGPLLRGPLAKLLHGMHLTMEEGTLHLIVRICDDRWHALGVFQDGGTEDLVSRLHA